MSIKPVTQHIVVLPKESNTTKLKPNMRRTKKTFNLVNMFKKALEQVNQNEILGNAFFDHKIITAKRKQ